MTTIITTKIINITIVASTVSAGKDVGIGVGNGACEGKGKKASVLIR
jgi:hypothetical protein